MKVLIAPLVALLVAGGILTRADAQTPTTTVVEVARLAGADNPSTSALLSRVAWPDGAPVAYLGNAGADELPVHAARPHADGPLLLVPECDPADGDFATLPQATFDELRRLNVRAVVGLGGVCDEHLREAAMTPESLAAERQREAHARAASSRPAQTAASRAVSACESGTRTGDGGAILGSHSYTAKNRTSSASGAHQFIDGTTRRMGLAAPMRAHPPAVQEDAFERLWDGGRGASHWNESRSCWRRYL